ncbi:MAG: helix-turn-helix domain-containing protein [Candidatus Omnitrophota bacterium]
MAKKANTFTLGKFLTELRERKGVSLKDVETDTGIPNAYLSQLETGIRKKLPDPDRLRRLADYYNVTVQQLLEKAGYFQAGEVEETKEQKIEKAFLHVVSDPAFQYGTRLKGKYDLDAKRFIIEMYEKLTNKNLLPDGN